MGRGNAGARLRGMGRGNDAKTALGVIEKNKESNNKKLQTATVPDG